MASNSIGKEPECRDSVIDIAPDLPPADGPECREYCCRVPKLLRNLNKEAYTPKLVSIGPFHHGEEELRDIEMHKPIYLKAFLKRTGTSQEELLNIIKDNEVKIRRCYAETFDQKYCSEEFVNMILLDAIFIIELFLKVRDKDTEDSEEKSDYILTKPWLDIGIYYDLMLLENQLPFFVLEKLYMFAFNFDSSSCNHREEGKPVEEHKKDLEKEDAPFVKLSRNYFKGYDRQPLSIKIGKEVKHFTDLMRYLFCPDSDLFQKPPKEYLGNLYSATKLEYAGLKFIAVKDRCLLDITFSRNEFLGYFPCFNLSWLLSFLPCLKCFPCLERMQCILVVPNLPIYDSTEALFRNLMALEQCHYPFHAYICNYVMLINYLIKNEKDVDLLVEKNVIVNYIGSNAEVASLFNKLCFQIGEVTSCYYDLGQLLKRHYEHPWNHTLAVLRNMYFGDFGRGIATVAALLTLVGLFVPFVTDIGSKRN